MKKLRHNPLWKVPECKQNHETYFKFLFFRLDVFKNRQTAFPVEVPPELKKALQMDKFNGFRHHCKFS